MNFMNFMNIVNIAGNSSRKNMNELYTFTHL